MSGEIFLADAGNHRIQRLSADSGTYINQTGAYGSQPGQFDGLSDTCYDSQLDQLVVADTDNNRIQFFQLSSYGDFATTQMSYSNELTTIADATPDTLSGPMAVACTSTETTQIIYIADTGNNRILKIENVINKSGKSPLNTWEAFKAALLTDDLDGAVECFYEPIRNEYYNILDSVRSHFNDIATSMGNMNLKLL